MTARDARRSPRTAMPAPGEAPVRNARTLRPKDAATLILVDRTGPAPRILMGRRRASQVFLPNKFVFPGGRVDRCDRTMPALGNLPELDRARLLHDMKGQPSDARARALGLTAIRETFEEAGLVVGTPPPTRHDRAGSRPPAHATWRQFMATGHLPRLSGLTFLARAITPPARPRRYDTRFFMADATLIASRSGRPDEELCEIGWFTLDEIRTLELPNITRAVIEDLAQRLADPDPRAPVPYYRYQRGTFHRDLIA